MTSRPSIPVPRVAGPATPELDSLQGAITAPATVRPAPRAGRSRVGEFALAARRRPELLVLIAIAALLNLWALSRNGWANEYYSAAVRSMSSSWHNFLFGSFDPSGVMTVDKPPMALWVQALSVRLFGYHPLSMLVPQALMGVASVALIYDLVRRRFGRLGGFVAGLALAITPMTVAISRHNNPDALLVLCCVAALWFAVRGLEDGRTRWLVLSGVSVGLAFETKMGVVLMVVPAIVAAWLWVAPRGRLATLRQLLAGGAAMVIVGGAWPALVALTPAADRPWISGTSDNNILSLILNYNGVGRLDGQAGGPGGIGNGGPFGGTPGPLRLLNSALGGQGGWLLGFALVCGIGILVASRARRADPRTGWLIAVGGSFLTTATVFSEAKGIFHPYYVSQLAPFTAALVGAGAGQLARRDLNARIVGPLAIAAGVATELAVLHQYPGQLTWLAPLLVAVGVLAAAALIALTSARLRAAAACLAVGALLIGPAIWSVDTLGHATSGTFPAGGPASNAFGGPGGGPGPFGAGGPPGFAGAAGARGSGVQLFGPGGGAGAGTGGAAGAGGGAGAGAGAGAQAQGGPPSGAFPRPGGGRGGRGGGPFGDDRSLTQVLAYVRQHGGGTVAVSSQSGAASAIIAQGAQVAGIGGFSGRESSVSIAWLAQEVSSGRIRWVLSGGGGPGGSGGPGGGGGPFAGGGLPGDTRSGSTSALSAAARACRSVSVGSTAASGTAEGQAASTIYDCQGRGGGLLALAGAGSR